MTDLTKITTPFGLLDRETQEALRAHGGPYEMYLAVGWSEWPSPEWGSTCVYRVKPAAPKSREMTGVWNSRRRCFEVYVTNVDYPHLMKIRLTGVLP